MRKLSSLIIAMMFFIAIAANAASVSGGAIVDEAGGSNFLDANSGFVVTLSQYSSNIIKAKISFKGTANKVSGFYCTFDYDKSTYSVVDPTTKSTPYAAAVSTDSFAEYLGDSTLRTTDWPALYPKLNPTATRAYVTLGFERKDGTVNPRTVSAGDLYNVYFKVNNSTVLNSTNFGTYFYVPTVTGPEKGNINFYTSSQAVVLKTPTKTGVDTATNIQSVSFETIEFEAPAVVDNTITANITGKGKVFIDNAPYAGKVTLPTGDNTATIKIIPNLGYTVETATLTGATGNIVNPIGGTYDATISGDATLAVTFVPVAETIGANKPMPSQKVFKETKDVGGVLKPANTTFAAAPSTGIVECGIYLEKDGAAYTKFGGPYFKSDNTNANGQYGIEFVGFEKGSYTATPYVKYTSTTEAATLAGTSVAFVVE